MKEELEGNSYYKGFSSTKVKKITRGHNTGYGFTFTATILAVPVQGECFMAVSGKRLLTYVSQAENAKYMSQLNEIVSGIRVK